MFSGLAAGGDDFLVFNLLRDKSAACKITSSGKWSWWFEEGTWDDMAYIGFELKEEAVLFKLIFPQWRDECFLGN